MKGAALLFLVASLAGCVSDTPDADLRLLGPAPEVTAGDWIQGGPTSIAALEGKVVLVDFWTYSCINCIRTLPFVTDWYDTYKDDGFVVLGIHSPEFDFEKDPDNVLDAIARHGIHYPVAQDNDFRVWREYQGERGSWPAKYLIDAQGMVRYTKIGEGAYETTEENIRALLLEAGATDLPPRTTHHDDAGPRGSGVTRELYAGTWRQDDAIGNPEGYRAGRDVTYSDAIPDEPHRIYLDGVWHNGKEALTAKGAGSIGLTFHAGGANFVADGPVGACVPVFLDGEPIPADLAGPDVFDPGSGGCIPLQETPRHYDFYAGPVEPHTVRFDVPDGFALYTFAFSAYPNGETPP